MFLKKTSVSVYCYTWVTISVLCTGSTLAATCVLTGITENAWVSQRRRPRRWTTTSVWSVNGARRAAQKSCTASVRRHTMSPSKEMHDCVFCVVTLRTCYNVNQTVNYSTVLTVHVKYPLNMNPECENTKWPCVTTKSEYFLFFQVLHWLWPMPELVPWSLCGNLAERGQPHRWIRVPTVPVDRGRHDGLHAAHWQGLWRLAENSAFLTSKQQFNCSCTNTCASSLYSE